MPGIDFSKRYRDYARFLPAISEMYTRFVTNANPKRTCPVSQQDLDFLEPTSNLYHIPYALYSAGQAAKSKNAAHRKDMVTGRNRAHGNIIVGDSGGFQIQQGSIKFTGDETRERMMRWLEANCDWSMVLDFPTGGIGMGTVPEHTKRLIREGEDIEAFCKSLGLTPSYETIGFATCLKQTLLNNDYFAQHRAPGATQFLNVVQGRTLEESNIWYEAVKHYEFEGWSLAGPHKENFDMTLTRFIAMRDDGLLQNKNWTHILGVGKLANGCAYTTMQREIRKHYNPDFTLSYDVSSPFTTAAYGNLFLGYTLDKNAWTIQSCKMDGRHYLPSYDPKDPEQAVYETDDRGRRVLLRKGKKGKPDEYRVLPNMSKVPFLEELRKSWDTKVFTHSSTMMGEAFHMPDANDLRNNSRFVETEVGKRLSMGDVCVNEDLKFTSTWDVVTYALLMNHNVQVHMEAVFESQELYDNGDTARVPAEMLQIKEIIEQVLDPATPNPHEIIKQNQKVLRFLSGDKAEAGVAMTGDFEFTEPKEYNLSLEKMKEHNKAQERKFTTVGDIFA